MATIRAGKDQEKREAVRRAIVELDRLNQLPYKEITNGKLVKGQLQGGTEKERTGTASWHEADARRIMLLRHNYEQGDFSGEADRSTPKPSGRVPLQTTFSSDRLFDLANFVEAHDGEAELVEELREQGFRLLASGEETKVLETGRIALSFSIAAQNRAHREGRHFWYVSEEGHILVKYAPASMKKTP